MPVDVAAFTMIVPVTMGAGGSDTGRFPLAETYVRSRRLAELNPS
jgi:hypothetical protein